MSISLNPVTLIATSPDDDAMTNTSLDTPRSSSPSPSSSNNHSKDKNDTSDETKRTKTLSESSDVSLLPHSQLEYCNICGKIMPVWDFTIKSSLMI